MNTAQTQGLQCHVYASLVSKSSNLSSGIVKLLLTPNISYFFFKYCHIKEPIRNSNMFT